MKVYEKEVKSIRNTANFENTLNNKINEAKNESIDNRAKNIIVSSEKLLKKYIPKLKPIVANFNPSPLILKEKEESKIEKEFIIVPNKKSSKKLFHKFNSVEFKTEMNEMAINSNDEGQTYNRKKHFSTSDENNGIKCRINTLRKKLDTIKREIKIKKYKDDSNLDFFYENNDDEENRLKSVEKYKEKIKLEKMEEYEKYKNKTISFKDMKFFKPPILGFLEMNDIESNSNLSTRNLPKF